MDGPGNCHNKRNKSDRERQISHNIAYMQNLKNNDINELTKQKQSHRLRGQTQGYSGERAGGRDRMGLQD